MDTLDIKYRTTGKSIPPRPIRLSIPGWAGGAVRKRDGSEPQPWHCPPFVEGSTYGLEIVYPYETECHVINDDGEIRFEWDYAREPDIKLHGEEFAAFFPRPSRYYLFNTGLDLQAPPGHVLRTQPHPRYFTDDTGTVPLALMGHVQTEWFPRTIFCVFRTPRPGQRHIFRKGEPYVQVLFVPHRLSYEPVPMSEEEAKQRSDLERTIGNSAGFIAKNVWHNPEGHEFKDHYKTLGRAFARDGMEGVMDLVEKGAQRHAEAVPKDLGIEQSMERAYEFQRQGKYVEARTLYLNVLARDPRNAEAVSRLGIVAAATGSPVHALELMTRAVQMQPSSASYHANLGETLRRLGQFQQAEACFRSSLQLDPRDADVLSNLGLALAQQGRTSEAIQACRAAITMDPRHPLPYYRLGMILAQQGQFPQARAAYETALAHHPGFAPAQRALQQLAAAPAKG